MATLLMKAWEQDMKNFVQTRACKEVENKIKAHNLVIVKGHSGSGKSAIIHHIALTYKNQGWTVKPVNKVKTFSDAYISKNSESKILFVIDDPFGKESFNEKLYNSWADIECYIKGNDETFGKKNSISNDSGDEIKSSDKSFKIIMSSRKFDTHSSTVEGLLNDGSYIVDITGPQWKLNDGEKREMFKQYTSNMIVADEECEKIIKNEAYFPLLCKLYATEEINQKEGAIFFEQPVEVLKKEIRSYRCKQKEKYCSLVLLAMFNNKLNIEKLIENDLAEKKFRKALVLCGFEKTKEPSKIRDWLDLLNGFLVKNIGNTYHFSHDFVMEVTNFIFGEDYPLTMIEYVDTGFLGRRVKTPNCSKSDDPFIIHINTKEHINALGKRLFREILTERLLDVVLNPCIRNEVVIDIFKDEIEQNPEQILLEQKMKNAKMQTSEVEKREMSPYRLPTSKLSIFMIDNENLPLSALIAFCHNDLSLFCLKTLEKNKINISKKSIFFAVCCNGSVEMFKMFPKEKARQYLTERWGYYNPIHIASMFHNHELLQELIKIGASVNQNIFINRLGGPAPLAISVTGYTEENETCEEKHRHVRRTETVRVLLNNGANVNSCKLRNGLPLIEACEYGYEGIVELLLQNDAEINIGNPLTYACQKGHENIVKLLIKHGTKINTIDTFCRTPLYHACKNGHENTVRLLLNSNAKINSPGCNKWYPLHRACQNGYEGIVQLLLNNNAKVNVVNRFSESPLFFACQSGCENIVQLLINKSANVNHTKKDKRCPILGACKHGHVNIVNLLFEYDAEINLCDQHGCSPLSKACEYGHERLAQILLAKGASINALSTHGGGPLHRACKNGHENIVILLLREGACVNLSDADKTTPIHEACKNGHEHIVKILLENSAVIDAISKRWGSPLCIACENGHKNIVDILLKKDADITLCSKYKISPIHAACKNGHEHIVEVLLRRNADCNLCSEDNTTPLHQACENGHERIVNILLDRHASCHAVSKDGNSPLLLACKKGHGQISDLLIEHGADINLCCKNGISPLHGACKNGLVNIVKILLDNDALINAVSKTCGSPLLEACQNGHEQIVSLLLNYGADVNICHEYEKDFFSEMLEFDAMDCWTDKYNDITVNKKITPLYKACQNKSESIVKHLLAKRADINLCGENKKTPLHKACENGDKTIVQLLLGHDADIKVVSKDWGGPFHEACGKGHESIVELLLDRGVDINEDSEFRGSPLHVACHFGNDDIVKLLLEKNADINAINKYFGHPIHQACKMGHCSIVKLLIEKGAEINAVKTTSGSPLHEACENKHKNIVRLLLQSGADVEVYNKNNMTPCEIASTNKYVGIVQLFKESGSYKCFDFDESSDGEWLQNLFSES